MLTRAFAIIILWIRANAKKWWIGRPFLDISWRNAVLPASYLNRPMHRHCLEPSVPQNQMIGKFGRGYDHPLHGDRQEERIWSAWYRYHHNHSSTSPGFGRPTLHKSSLLFATNSYFTGEREAPTISYTELMVSQFICWNGEFRLYCSHFSVTKWLINGPDLPLHLPQRLVGAAGLHFRLPRDNPTDNVGEIRCVHRQYSTWPGTMRCERGPVPTHFVCWLFSFPWRLREAYLQWCENPCVPTCLLAPNPLCHLTSEIPCPASYFAPIPAFLLKSFVPQRISLASRRGGVMFEGCLRCVFNSYCVS